MEKRRTFGLFTGISMIVGVVVGSGIFFKADDILFATGANVSLGVLVLLLGALSIIFGSLTLSQFAQRCDSSGGFVSYFDEFISPKSAAGFGVFQTFIYYPTVNAVVSYATAIYFSIIMNWDLGLEKTCLLGYLFFIVLSVINIFSRKFGAFLQNATTIIKLIPLFLIAFLGFTTHVEYTQEITNAKSVGLGFLTALVPIAFSYDGWPISTTIAKEVKNAKKTMTLSLIIAPLIILLAYVLFFTGVTRILDPNAIVSLKDSYLDYIFVNIFGNTAGRILTIFVFVAILGVSNGISLGGIRMPQALSEKGILFKEDVSYISPKYQISLKSAIIYIIICTIWSLINYITIKFSLLNHSDISEIAIVFSYLTYIVLYIKVIKMYKTGEVKSKFMGLFAPIIAILTAGFIAFGAVLIDFRNVSIYILFCAIVFVFSMRLKK